MNGKTYAISRRSFIAKAGIALAALSTGGLWTSANAASAKWDAAYELLVTVEINQPSSGRYNRPYVAVWLEDAAGRSVRTLAVWADSGRGSRWIPDLRRWYAGNSALVSTTSSATRNPGKYNLVWDGLNDKKQAVDQGEYFVCIEAAREHGTYQLIRQPVTVATKAWTITAPGNEEIKGASLELRKKS